MNLRDVGLETSVNDTVQTNKNVKYTSKMLAQRYKKKMLKCNKNNYKSTKKTIIIIKSTDISLDRQASSASVNYSLFVDL